MGKKSKIIKLSEGSKMGKGLGLILILLGAFLLFTIYQNGVDTFKQDPAGTSMSTVKFIYYEGKKIIENQGGMTLNCMIDSDCNILEECNDDCICNVENGKCYK